LAPVAVAQKPKLTLAPGAIFWSYDAAATESTLFATVAVPLQAFVSWANGKFIFTVQFVTWRELPLMTSTLAQ